MSIDPKAPYLNHLALLEYMDEDSKKRLQDYADSVYGSPWSLALRDFFALSEGDLSYIGLAKEDYMKANVCQYVWMKSFRECVEQVTEILKSLQVPQSPESQRASKACLKMGFKEATLVFTRRYFGLHNFTEAENIPLGDFIVAKKDDFNGNIYQYRMSEIQKAKLKQRR